MHNIISTQSTKATVVNAKNHPTTEVIHYHQTQYHSGIVVQQ